MSAVIERPRGRLLRREVAATATLALPMIIGKLSAVGQNTIDVLLAGHLSAHVLAAVSVGTAMWILAFMISSGVAYALSPAVARLDGAGQRQETGALFAQALRLAFVLGLALMLLLRWGGPEVARLAGTVPSLMPDVTAFLHAASWGIPALSVYLVCQGFSEGLSMPRPSMVTGILGLIVLAPVGYVLMYGGLGIPSLGAYGSGLAASIVPWVETIAMLAWIAFSGRYDGIGWLARRRGTDWAVIRRLLAVGGPIAVSQLSESTLFTAAALVISRFGEAAAASHQIAIIVASTTFMVPLGLAFAITVRVGNAVGRADPAGVRRAGLVGMGMALAVQASSATLFLLAPQGIAGLFTNDPGVIAGAAVLLMLAGAFQLSDGLQVASMGALRGIQDTAVPMLITTGSYWGVGMTLGTGLALGLGWEAVGMWCGMIAGLTVAAGLLATRFLRLSRWRGA